jgi:hypothetical protein
MLRSVVLLLTILHCSSWHQQLTKAAAATMQRKRECCAIALGSGANEAGCRNNVDAMQERCCCDTVVCHDEKKCRRRQQAENGAAEYILY